jgi:inosine-uridine nucleoside N-ribohydrolase
MTRHYRSGERATEAAALAQKIIMDCDPGIDDALAIAFAWGHPDLELLGITTVAGNVSLAKTTANALRVCEFIGAAAVPVVAGSPRPLLRTPMTAHGPHGDSGLAGARLPPPASAPRPGHAVDFLIDTIGGSPGEITLVATGPLTNVALAVRRQPDLVSQVRDFVIMGGSASRGNLTPAAEFNIAADPEAAAIVFDAGWTVTMVGLDVTLRTRAGPAVRKRIAGLGRLADDLLLPCLASYATTPGEGGPAVHDVCAVAWLASPGLLGCVPARVEIETAGRWTAGMTVTSFEAPPAERNALVAMEIDVDGFWDLVIGTYALAADAARLAGPPGTPD